MAESLGVKFAKWDKADGYEVSRDCYNSYFYAVESNSTDVMDKLRLQGEEVVKYLDGGSALHLNLEEHPTKEGYARLISLASKYGCNYFTTNVPATCCEEPGCGYINKANVDKCIRCGSDNVTHATRIIGYLRKTSSFSKERQTEEAERYYH